MFLPYAGAKNQSGGNGRQYLYTNRRCVMVSVSPSSSSFVNKTILKGNAMPDCILVRHGKRDIKTGEKSGDGPLTSLGRAGVHITAFQLATDLIATYRIGVIDLAIVSGSIRCAETFAIVWKVLLEKSIFIAEYDMRKEYFSTPEEDAQWATFWAEKEDVFREAQKRLGEKGAVRKHAWHLVAPCVDRTLERIRRACDDGAQTVLCVTHGPHDAFIAECLTGQEHEGLAQGGARIVSF